MSASGFRNMKALSRVERFALKDKVALEKDRLMKRHGPEAKHYRANAPVQLITPEPDAAGFLSDADRFHTDVSGEEYLARRSKFEQKEMVLARKRVQGLQREESRWEEQMEKKAQEEAYWARQRDQGDKSKKNESSVPHDILTLTYAPGLEGERLRLRDDRVRYRAELRAINLQRNGDTRVDYNILTGQHHNRSTDLPQRPEPHQELKEHIENTYNKANGLHHHHHHRR